MKVTIPTILLGMLSLSTCAFAYLDYNELDARDSTNSLLVERNTVEVPFQHSLRSFLAEAADAHRRALDDHEDLLEARKNPNMVNIYLAFQKGPLTERPPWLKLKVPRHWDASALQKEIDLHQQYSRARWAQIAGSWMYLQAPANHVQLVRLKMSQNGGEL